LIRHFFLVGLIASLAPHPALGKSYWEGHQLNNQARLGQPFNGFEEDDPEKKEDTASASYQAHLKATRGGQAAGADGGAGQLVDMSGTGLPPFLSIARLPDGGQRMTVRLQILFVEGSAQYRVGGVESISRLNALYLAALAKGHVEWVFTDDAGDAPGVGELHLERLAAVLAYLVMNSDAAAP